MTHAAYTLARTFDGLSEIRGDADEQRIVGFFADVGHDWVKDDETAWCAAFVGAMLERTGTPSTRKLNARSYLDWGHAVRLEDAEPGDLVVFSRGDPDGWRGHVGFYAGHGKTYIKVFGGNQSDAVNDAFYARTRLLGVRRYRKPTTGFLARLLMRIVDAIRARIDRSAN